MVPYGGAITCHRQFFASFCAGEATLRQQLQRETAGHSAETSAANTKKTYQTHLNSYLRFCELLDILNQCRRQKKTGTVCCLFTTAPETQFGDNILTVSTQLSPGARQFSVVKRHSTYIYQCCFTTHYVPLVR